jgi:hypothetical protein
MFRNILFGGLMLLTTSAASAQEARPVVGGIGSPPDAMIFYLAHGAADACGPGCSDWIAAEGTVQWDTHKRLFNILDRYAGRRLPVVIHVWGASNLNVATTLGRILRERGIDTTAGTTEVDACKGKSEAECFALKRPGGPLEARIKSPDLRQTQSVCAEIMVKLYSNPRSRNSRRIGSGMDATPFAVVLPRSGGAESGLR